jgi:putative peptidoglycan lipid II flippase
MPLGGLALANSAATILETLILVWLVRRRLGGLGRERLWASAWRTALSAGVMGAALWGYVGVAPAHPLWAAGGGVLVGGGVFLACSAFLRSPELSDVLGPALGAIRRRLG